MTVIRKRVGMTTPCANTESNTSSSRCPSLSSSVSSLEQEELPEYSDWAHSQDQNQDQDTTLHEQQEPFTAYPEHSQDRNLHEEINPSLQSCQPSTSIQPDSDIKIGHYVCSLLHDQPAVWYWPQTSRLLSEEAATILSKQGLLNPQDLKAITYTQFSAYPPSTGPTDPFSGLLLATFATVHEIISSTADICIAPTTLITSHPPSRMKSAKKQQNGLTRLTLATLSAPRDFTLALAEGFSNVPRLYGDETRPAPVITGLGSGLVAAGKGFTENLTSGLTGFVTHPINGAREAGILGAVKGVGKGIGGLVCKPCAGTCGVPAYALQGVHMEISKVGSAVERVWTSVQGRKMRKERNRRGLDNGMMMRFELGQEKGNFEVDEEMANEKQR